MKKLIFVSTLMLSILGLVAQETPNPWPNAEVSVIRSGNGKKPKPDEAIEVHFFIRDANGNMAFSTYEYGIPGYWTSSINPLRPVPQAQKLLEEEARLKFLIPVEEFKKNCPPNLKDYDWPGDQVYAELDILRILPELPMAYSAFTSLMEEKGPDAAVQALGNWLKDKTPDYYLGEDQLNWIGYALLKAEAYDQAIAIFKKNIKRHPGSWNTHDSLAEAYLKAGDKEKARKHLKKALRIKPDFKPSVRKLAEM